MTTEGNEVVAHTQNRIDEINTVFSVGFVVKHEITQTLETLKNENPKFKLFNEKMTEVFDLEDKSISLAKYINFCRGLKNSFAGDAIVNPLTSLADDDDYLTKIQLRILLS